MRAIEFKTRIKDGMSMIPEKYHKMAGKIARVIILTEEEESNRRNEDSESLEAILEKIQAKQVFQGIQDPQAWQRAIRNEWDERTSWY